MLFLINRLCLICDEIWPRVRPSIIIIVETGSVGSRVIGVNESDEINKWTDFAYDPEVHCDSPDKHRIQVHLFEQDMQHRDTVIRLLCVLFFLVCKQSRSAVLGRKIDSSEGHCARFRQLKNRQLN